MGAEESMAARNQYWFCVLFSFILKQSLTVAAQPVLDSLCSPDWPQIQGNSLEDCNYRCEALCRSRSLLLVVILQEYRRMFCLSKRTLQHWWKSCMCLGTQGKKKAFQNHTDLNSKFKTVTLNNKHKTTAQAAFQLSDIKSLGISLNHPLPSVLTRSQTWKLLIQMYSLKSTY